MIQGKYSIVRISLNSDDPHNPKPSIMLRDNGEHHTIPKIEHKKRERRGGQVSMVSVDFNPYMELKDAQTSIVSPQCSSPSVNPIHQYQVESRVTTHVVGVEEGNLLKTSSIIHENGRLLILKTTRLYMPMECCRMSKNNSVLGHWCCHCDSHVAVTVTSQP